MDNTNQKYLGTDIIPVIKQKVELKQDKLVSGVNIKTINGKTLLGEGDVEIVDKLYTETGNNTDGAMTQKAVSDELNTINTTLGTATSDIAALKTAGAKSVQFDTEIAEDNSSTVTIVKKTGALDAEGEPTATELPLPVASATQAGVMNTAMYNSLQETADKVEAILGATVSVSDLPAEPTQEQLTTAWKAETGKEELINGAKINDSTNAKVWTYYSNTSKWESVDTEKPTFTIAQFTNTQAGTIKGSDEPGRVHAEADGEGSVNGWDEATSQIDTNTSNIAANATAISGLQTSKQDMLVSGTSIKTVNGESLLGAGDIAIEVPAALTVAEFNSIWDEA